MRVFKKDANGKWIPEDAEVLKKTSSKAWFKMKQQETRKKIGGKWV